MESNEVVKALREERGFTIAKLAEGIMSREALNKFELRGTSMSSEKLTQILSKLNVTYEEYLSRLDMPSMDSKKAYDRLFRQALMHPTDEKYQALQQQLATQYAETADVFFQIKKEQFAIEYNYMKHHTIEGSQSGIAYIQTYLNSIDTWGKFEISIFGSCMFAFTNDYIYGNLNRLNRRIHSLIKESTIHSEFSHILLNALILLVAIRKDYTYGPKLLAQLLEYTNDTTYMYEKICGNIFQQVIDKKAQFTIHDVEKELSILRYLGYDEVAAGIESVLVAHNS